MSDSKSTGVSLSGILFTIFLVLKLAGVGVVANWSWWEVTAPLWVPAALVVAVVVVLGAIAVIVKLFKK